MKNNGVAEKDHCDKNKIDFLSTPFSQAVTLLDKLNMKFWKIASGEVSNFPMIDIIAKQINLFYFHLA